MCDSNTYFSYFTCFRQCNFGLSATHHKLVVVCSSILTSSLKLLDDFKYELSRQKKFGSTVASEKLSSFGGDWEVSNWQSWFTLIYWTIFFDFLSTADGDATGGVAPLRVPIVKKINQRNKSNVRGVKYLHSKLSPSILRQVKINCKFFWRYSSYIISY